ncbi:MAG: uroporphyrinogen decarboxylase family protein [Planctomycetaceae bacterium]|nr:uroporphyrinogen decarboxylase family protein [Planctomycetaceae bacterium]
MKRNMNEWVSGLISGKKRAAMPILTSPGIPLIDAAPIDVFQSGELQFRAIRALIGRLPDMAAALTMMDLSVEAQAFGSPIKFSEVENPTVSAAVVRDQGEINRLAIPEVGAARTAETLLAAELCATEINDRPTLGGLIGPFSLTGRLLDMSAMMLMTAAEPETVHALLEKVTQFLIEYAKAFKATGCHGLIMAEPAAGLISPKMCREFSADYIKRIVDAVRDDSFAFVLHNCGKTEKMVQEMLSTGCSALHVGNTVDVRKILDQVPAGIPVMGNLDPSVLFRMGTPDDMLQATAELLEATRDYPNFVLSSGCDIPPGTPLDNVLAFFDALAEYNSRT